MQKAVLNVFVAIVGAISLSQAASATVESFGQRMDAIVADSENGKEVIGVEVVSLNKGDILYAHNEDAQLNPASCTKIITTAAALKLLGPEFKFHTKFYTDQYPRGGRAEKLWVKGYGDPSIVIERLWRIARDIANTGLKEIAGDIVIDDYYFDEYTYPGYQPESTHAYNSLTGAVSLNFNTVTIVAIPASRVGDPPHVSPDTGGPYFRIINTAKTGPRGSENTLAVSRLKKGGEDIIEVGGSMPIQSAPQYIYKNISDPPLYFGLALKSLLEQNGVRVGGNVVRGMAPGGGYMILDSVSKPLSLIIQDMNKYSNNFIAEQVVKVLGAAVGNAAGTTENGIKVIEEFLAHLGIPKDSYKLINGSGLTAHNRVPASILVTILAHLNADSRIAPEAISSLSVAGLDGTIKDLHNEERLKGVVRAKTGSLAGVSSLVGTVPSDSGEMIGYAILMNGSGLSWDASRKIQETMLNAMTAFSR